jgi:hypothetical protein
VAHRLMQNILRYRCSLMAASETDLAGAAPVAAALAGDTTDNDPTLHLRLSSVGLAARSTPLSPTAGKVILSKK